jgi:predicted HicB family RNase H-like nuclease
MSKYAKTNTYNAENYFKVALRIPKEKKEILQKLADDENTSINKLIVNAVEKFYGVNLSRKE